MTTSSFTPISNYIDSLPALPAIVTRVMEITRNPESSANDLMQAILPDQSMCAAILKIANSAFFGFPRKVDTIENAVMVLGFTEVQNIVLGKAVFNSFKKLTIHNQIDIENFWAHSFTCGLAAKIIAEDLGHSPSKLFIGGLLHDIGKLAMLVAYAEDYSHLLKLSGPLHFNSTLEEREIFTISHDDVGHKILHNWFFPEQLTQAVGYHHFPGDSPDSSRLPMIIQMADIIALTLSNSETINLEDLKTMLRDFHPEIPLLWEKHSLSYETRLNNWLQATQESLEKDSAILETFSS